MERRIILAAVLMLLFAGSAAALCGDSTSCDDCASAYSCGWCINEGTCHEGTSSGATDGACSDPDWAWYRSECPGGSGVCDFSTCNACTGASGCGWCSNTGACYQGTADGPTSGMCSGTNWVWYNEGCGLSDPCSAYATCDDCTFASGCGWCDSGVCKSGTYSGSTDGLCSGDGWMWASSECSLGYDNGHACSYDSQCASSNCVHQICRATNPYCGDGYCDSGESSTSCATDCGEECDYATCDDCTAVSGCGWCKNTAACEEGVQSGPNDESCSGANWAWGTSQCGVPPGECTVGQTTVEGVCIPNTCSAQTAPAIITGIATKSGQELDTVAQATTESSVGIATNIVAGAVLNAVTDRLMSFDSLRGLKNAEGSGMIAKAKRLIGAAVDRGIQFVVGKAARYGISADTAMQMLSRTFTSLQEKVAEVGVSTGVGGLSAALEPVIRDYVVEPVIGTERYKADIAALSPAVTCPAAFSANSFSAKFRSMEDRRGNVEAVGSTLEAIFTNDYLEAAAEFISTNPFLLAASSGGAAAVYPTWKSAQLISVAGVIVVGAYESYGVKSDALDCYGLMGGNR